MNKPLLAAIALLTLNACALLNKPALQPQQWFSLDAVSAAKNSPGPATQTLSIAKIHAPHWLLGDGLYYRLAYRDALNLQPYAQSHWVAPPPQQLAQLLRSHLVDSHQFAAVAAAEDRVHSDYELRLWLDDFSQVHTSTTASHARLHAQAMLIGANRQVLAQTRWALELPATGVDALAGAQALNQAGHQWIQRLGEWLAENTKH